MDIRQTVNELLATGLTQQQIADRVQCSQSLIAALANGTRGKQTSMTIGVKLVELHTKLCNLDNAGGEHAG